MVLSTEDLQEEEIHDEEVGAGSGQNFWKTRHVETVPAALAEMASLNRRGEMKIFRSR